MPGRTALEDLEDLQARQRDLQARFAEVLAFHYVISRAVRGQGASVAADSRSGIIGAHYYAFSPSTDLHATSIPDFRLPPQDTPASARARSAGYLYRPHGLRLPHGHSAGELPGRPRGQPVEGRDDP